MYEPYPYYHSGFLTRNVQEYNYQVMSILLDEIKKGASTIDLYMRLAKSATDENHRNDILYALEGKKASTNQLTNLYINLTGTKPLYQIVEIPFLSYEEGLEKAFEAEGYFEDRNHSLLNQDPIMQNILWLKTNAQQVNAQIFRNLLEDRANQRKDYGRNPYVVDIEKVTKQNKTFRTSIWTGNKLQVTLMSIDVGDSIGLENHPNTDQFLRIEEGQGLVQMGDRKDRLDYVRKVSDDFAIMVPAGKWHNLTNTGNKPLKLYSIYAPPEHPFGTVHRTKAEAMAAEESRNF
ncbi:MULTISPECIES: cupin domain-containing protein [Bacillaceae]|uniref:cupin domain-containing protein n=1 Tax=Bacillaceae TaxID=186817 RepID=UPI000BFC48BD|nr:MULTISPECIES: cupin domain-containing protein [Bacillaceae]PGT75013.1 cupin [Bacillus sp. AFS040349]UGB32906.1 cupin domain-containing protein [Metabacillus sp. B2-18]